MRSTIVARAFDMDEAFVPNGRPSMQRFKPWLRAILIGSTDSKAGWPRFSKAAGDEMSEAINSSLAEARDILAVAGNFQRPLGSASRGTLRAVSTDGSLDLEMDLPDGEIGDAVVAAHEAAGVIARPLIDMDRSVFTDGPDGRTYTKPWLRAILIGSTDSKAGWPDPVISEAEGPPNPPKTTAEKIAALSKIGQRRNRLWF